MSTRTSRDVGVGDLPGIRRLLVAGLGGLFWLWLLARWVTDRILAPGVNTSDREPFVPPGPLEAAATRAHGVAGGLDGPTAAAVNLWAGTLEFLAFGARSMPALATGARLTVFLTVLSILLGLVIAVPLAVARTYGGRPLRGVALGYTELIRGTPLLAQLFVVYYGLSLSGPVRGFPGIGGPLPRAAVWVAVVGFTINSSAYQAEYIRSALESVDAGQLAAARSVGLSRLEGIRHVVLPQGLRYAIPGWTNELIYLVKYSSLAAFITVPELFRRARSIASDSFRVLDIYLWVALLYLGLVLTLSLVMNRVEARVAVPGVGTDGRD